MTGLGNSQRQFEVNNLSALPIRILVKSMPSFTISYSGESSRNFLHDVDHLSAT
jgi:hypothetical protein